MLRRWGQKSLKQVSSRYGHMGFKKKSFLGNKSSLSGTKLATLIERRLNGSFWSKYRMLRVVPYTHSSTLFEQEFDVVHYTVSSHAIN